MEGRFPFPGGVLTCREQRGQVTLCMEREAGEGLYRGWLRGKTGRMDLGTLLPDGNCLRLRRTVTAENLRRLGCWPVTAAGAELTYAFSQAPPKAPEGWRWEDGPGRLFPGDPILRQAAERGGRCLCRREGDGLRLAYCWDTGKPFPLPPAFCFGQIERIGGADRVVFSFSGEGRPEMPGKSGGIS